MKDLTEKQKKVLRYIGEYINEHKFPPTTRETATAFNISVKGAYDHIRALLKKGKLQRDGHRSRTLKIVAEKPEARSLIEIPVLGRIVAGLPLLTEENLSGYLTVKTDFLAEKGIYFAFHIKGDSMRGAGILDGDLGVFLHKTEVRDGEIVAAMLSDDQMTLKRYFKEKNRVKLQPANPEYAPTYHANIRIQGILRRIIRRYD